MPDDDRAKGPLPTGWFERGARLAGQTGRSALRFVGTRARSFAAPDRAGEFLDEFHQQTARQLAAMLGEMKGAAMKLGQLASFYEFAAPGEYLSTYADAMTMLQSSAPPMDPAASRRVIEEEFGVPVEDVFASFRDEPLASASIGQVHEAELPGGTRVAVKVQYPGVDEAVRSDMRNVGAMTKLAVAIAPNLDPREVAREVRERVFEELDYTLEMRNQQRFYELYDGHPFVVIPQVYPEYCRRRVITQELIEGSSFTDAFAMPQTDRDRIGEILFRFFYGSLHRFQVFSADPHPGNYLLLDDGRVAFLDFGLVRDIDLHTLRHLVCFVQALIADDRDAGREALEAIRILGTHTPEIDAVWEHMRMLNAPVLEDRDFTIDRPLVQRIAGAGFDPRSEAFQTLRKIGVPAVMITFNRMSFGVASLLGRLEATRNWQRIAREMWRGEPPCTELGEQEAAWLQRHHPDVVPVLQRTA